jgi:hypothetical protein
MAINRAQIAHQLVPGLNTIFGLAYKDVADEHRPLFDIESSKRAFEEDQLMTGFETAPFKSEGAAVQYLTAEESYKARYTHRTVAMAYALTEEAMEDNLYDTFSKLRSKALGRSMANTKQVEAANVYNNAFSTSYLGGDGAALCATHTLANGSTIANNVASDLSETALENAMIAIAGWTDDKGILIGAKAVSLHIPRNLMFVASRLLNSTMRPGVADNDINALNYGNYLPKGFTVNHRFTDTNAWFLRTDIPSGMKMFQRVGLSTKMEGDFDTGNMRYKARERYSFGWTDWRGLYGSAGST